MMDGMRLSSWLIRNNISKSEEVWLHGYTGAVDVLDENTIKNPSSSIKGTMYDKGYLTTKSEEEEKQHFLSLIDEIDARPNQSMVYVLQFSINCNFACTYCSENKDRRNSEFRKSKIQPAFFKNIKSLIIDTSADPRSDKLILFGGEPLLVENKPSVDAAIGMTDELSIGELEIITNGYNVDKYIDRFSGYNVSFQITLDGIEDVHNNRRIKKGSKKSYGKIIKNIEIALDCGLKVDLRVNVDHKNYKSIPLLFEQFVNLGFRENNNFSPYLAYVLDYGDYEQRMSPLDLYQYFETQNVLKLFSMGRDPFGLERMLSECIYHDKPFEFTSTYCGANKGNMIVFGPDGRLHACWDAGPEDIEVGRYYPFIDWNKRIYEENWLRRSLRNLPICRECKYALFCGGGCQYIAKKKHGNYFSPNCNGFQEVFDGVLVNVAKSCP